MHHKVALGRYAAIWLWLIVPAAIFAIYLLFGTPHMIISYSFLDNGRRHDPWAERHYTSCTFLAFSGQTVTVPARNGKCGWVRFFHQARPAKVETGFTSDIAHQTSGAVQ